MTEALVERVRTALGAGAGPVAVWRVPGRVELLGKHTDYAGGRSLLAALDRGLVIGMVPRTDARVTFLDTSSRARAAFAMDPGLVPLTGRWAGYPMTVARRLAQNFPEARRGADLALASDLSSASGMSSSSALVVATCLALAEASGLPETAEWRRHLATPEALAEYFGCIENGQDFGPFAGDRGVGTFGGSEDHTAIICCKDGWVSRYAFAPVRSEGNIRWPEGQALVIGVSGVRSRKTGAEREAYNRLSLAARRILERWRTASGAAAPTLAAAIAGPGAADAIGEFLDGERDPEFPEGFLAARFRQFVSESEEIIPRAATALAGGDLREFGSQVDRSQLGAEVGLRNQVPETMHLARRARELGAHAASAFGAGFGGSVWAMVDAEDARAFGQAWLDDFVRAFPASSRRAEYLVSRPSAPARRLL
ncbi:MAG TPA: galactokinase family protein [Gemmatimonadales bacterium]|nr:galactokinase family protein [Gemmatimonadales bacterium]